MRKLHNLHPGFLIGTLRLIFLLLWVLFPSQLFAATTWTVGPAGQDFPTIAEGIAAASSGDTVQVYPKTTPYQENITLKTGVIVEGVETARTKIDGNFTGSTGTVVKAAPNTVIQRLTIQNGDIGIDATGSSSVIIRNNLIVSNKNFGIQCDNALTNLQIVNNVIAGTNNTTNDGTGISCTSATTSPTVITIENNVLTNNQIGIALINFTNTIVSFNNFFGNTSDGTTGTDVVTGDPKFVAPTINDYHLQTGSACLDKGDPQQSFDDIEVSTSPVDHTQNDCGAYGGRQRDTTPFQIQKVMPTPGTNSITLTWDANLAYDIANYKIYFDNRNHTITNNVPTPAYSNSLTIAATTTNCPSTPTPPTCTVNLSLTLTAPINLQVGFGDSKLFPTWSPPPSNANLVTSYNVYFEEVTASTYLVENTNGNVISHILAGLTNFTTYNVHVTAIALAAYSINVTALDDSSPQHESSFLDSDVPNTINCSKICKTCSVPSCESPPSIPDVSNFPEPIVPFPDLPDQGHCFIATAAYGSPREPQVKILRAFRDEYLEHYDWGQRFIAWYYHHSPPWADYLNAHAWLKPTVRAALLPVVGIAYFFVATTEIEKSLVLILLMLFLLGGMFVMKKTMRTRD